MINKTWEQAAAMAGGLTAVAGETGGKGPEGVVITGVSTDTRTLRAGNLFVPLVGERYDGHDYVAGAFAKGAAAALWQEDRPNAPAGVPLILVRDTLAALQQLARSYRSELGVRIVGVTGSNGKTTTKDMIASILETTYKVHKTKGNLNNHIGLPLTLLQLAEDTEMAVIEMGMSGRGEIELLTKLARPETAIVTNIGESHLMQLGSRQAIAEAKTEILSGLTIGGLFIYNGDEPLLEAALAAAERPESMLTLRFGAGEDNDLYPTAMIQDESGTFFQTNLPDSPNYYIPLLGRHNVINALAAIAAGKYMGVTSADIARGLRSFEATSMRIEKLAAASGATILNDAYNASPTSMRAAVALLNELRGYHRKIVVLGDMLELGPDEARFHREIGELIDPAEVQEVYVYGTLGRQIGEAALTRYPASRVHVFADKARLIAQLRETVGAGDVVLVKASRGMKLEEVVQALLAA
ncbi:MAG: UDP-N-acetylmuramoyl-tripeptide--D-alanyl-D-alanine ligase [Paenibacillaceae bacterium]|nr:UDP-N-acetylmuramoyl-tripeptide--D-alanyl-D-alanine ligase [Paenibacillaceae bacterium]